MSPSEESLLPSKGSKRSVCRRNTPLKWCFPGPKCRAFYSKHHCIKCNTTLTAFCSGKPLEFIQSWRCLVSILDYNTFSMNVPASVLEQCSAGLAALPLSHCPADSPSGLLLFVLFKIPLSASPSHGTTSCEACKFEFHKSYYILCPLSYLLLFFFSYLSYYSQVLQAVTTMLVMFFPVWPLFFIIKMGWYFHIHGGSHWINHLFLPTSVRDKMSLQLNSYAFFGLLCILLVEPFWLLIYVCMYGMWV